MVLVNVQSLSKYGLLTSSLFFLNMQLAKRTTNVQCPLSSVSLTVVYVKTFLLMSKNSIGKQEKQE